MATSFFRKVLCGEDVAGCVFKTYYFTGLGYNLVGLTYRMVPVDVGVIIFA